MAESSPPFLDTSVAVRYLTGDPPAQVQAARHLMDSTEELVLTGVVIAEVAFVLSTNYQQPRERIVDGLVDLVSKRNIRIFELEKSFVVDGLLLCRPSRRVSFADALIWAAARTARAPAVYSFDARFPRGGVDVIAPR